MLVAWKMEQDAIIKLLEVNMWLQAGWLQQLMACPRNHPASGKRWKTSSPIMTFLRWCFTACAHWALPISSPSWMVATSSASKVIRAFPGTDELLTRPRIFSTKNRSAKMRSFLERAFYQEKGPAVANIGSEGIRLLRLSRHHFRYWCGAVDEGAQQSEMVKVV